jgi:hypothetical protein
VDKKRVKLILLAGFVAWVSLGITLTLIMLGLSWAAGRFVQPLPPRPMQQYIQPSPTAPATAVKTPARQGLIIRESGTPDKPLVYKGWEGSVTGPWSNAVEVYGSGVRLEGFKITGAAQYGILIHESATNVVVTECDISGVGIGVGVHGRDAHIFGNYIHDLKMVHNSVGGDDDYGAHAVGAYASVRIEQNQFVNCKAPSYDYGVDGGAVEIDGSQRYIESVYILDNVAINCDGFIEVSRGRVGLIVIEGNTTVDCGVEEKFLYIHTTGRHACVVDEVRLGSRERR